MKGLRKNTTVILLAECLAMMVIIYGVYLFGIKPFRINNDQMFQYPLFYKEWIRLLKDFFAGKGLPMYSWYSFLGSDFYASMGYYVTGDIFLPLFFLMDIDTALVAETVLCFLISCFSMAAFLNQYGIQNDSVKRFIALVYAFGGWAVLYIGQYMWHRFYAFLPLLFFAIEYYFKHQKTWVVSVTVTVLFLQNYYMMWPLSIFLFFYCLLRVKEEHRNLRNDAVSLMVAYGIGLAMSSILLVPNAIYVLNNPRVGNVTDTGLFWPLKVYAGFILNTVSSSFPVYTDISNLFRLDDNGYGYWYTLFITVIPLITSLAYITQPKERKWLGLTVGLVMVAWIKPLSSLMHGLSDPSMRWTFVLTFLLLYLSARGMDEQPNRKTEKNIMIGILIAAVLSIGYLLSQYAFSDYKEHYLSLMICLFVATVIYFVYQKNLKIAKVLTLVELAVNGCFNMQMYYHDIVYDDYRLGGSDQLTYLQDTDEDLLYRYEIPMEDVVPSSLNYNLSLNYHFLTAKTYNSLYSTTIDSFLHLQGINSHQIDMQDYYALNSIGVKYYLVLDESELPEEGDFTYVTDLNSTLKVYLDQNYKGFGYTLSNLDYFSDIESTEDLFDTLYIDDSTLDLSTYQNGPCTKFNVTAKGNNYLAGDITLESDNILFIAIPNDDGWKVRVDGSDVETVSVNGGFMGICLEEGYHTIEMSYVTPGLKAGILLSACGFITLVCQILWGHKKHRYGTMHG